MCRFTVYRHDTIVQQYGCNIENLYKWKRPGWSCEDVHRDIAKALKQHGIAYTYVVMMPDCDIRPTCCGCVMNA